MGKATLFGAAMLAVSMITVSAQAGPPAPFENCENYPAEDQEFREFQNVCAANLELKNGGHYLNSCADDGGKCDDSVDNKLRSALDKYLKGKTDDALMATCTIYDNAETWANSKRPKLTEEGFDFLAPAVDALADHIEDGAKCSP